MSSRQILALILVLVALVFIFENTLKVDIRLLVPVITMPLWLALLLLFALGLMIGYMLRRN